MQLDVAEQDEFIVSEDGIKNAGRKKKPPVWFGDNPQKILEAAEMGIGNTMANKAQARARTQEFLKWAFD